MRIIYESSVQPRENSRRRRPRPLRLPWLQLTALAYIFTYLVLGIWLAEVDLTQAPPLWQLLAGIVPPLELIPTPLVAFVRALLLPRVWLHLVVPGLLGWWLADRTATSFLFRFFRFPRHADAAAFQRRLLRTGSSLARRLVGSFTFPAVALRLAVITLPFILGLLVLQSPALSFINVPFFGRAPYVLLFLSWWLATACYLVLAGITIELPGPLVTRENLEKLRREEPLLRVGGPGPLIIGHSNVALAEKNGRFSRILGPGRQRLHHYEYIRTLLDLHAHETSVIASGITRDGIELQAELTVTYRLSHDDAYFASPDPLHQVTTIERQRPTRERPYPFGEQAVKAAAYGETVGNEGRMTWQELPLAIARGRFAKALAQRRLDEIFNPDEESTPSLYPALWEQTRREARSILRPLGIYLSEVRLGPLQAPDAVTAQNIDGWRAFWQKQRRLQLAVGKAEAMAVLEGAHKEAELMMLKAIVEGIRKAQREGGVRVAQNVVALRLVEALEKMVQETHQDARLLPHVMGELQMLQQQLAAERK